MPATRFNSIPRFALPYNAPDFAASLLAIVRGAPPQPAAFELLGSSPKFWTRSGRQSLRLILEALQLPAGSGVALPLFTDPSLVRAIAAAGHRPVFIDIDPRFLTIDPQSLEDVQGTFSAVLAVHLFGQLADMPAILDAAGGAPVIEDTAHAPLSYLHGRMAGNFGIASFYSFASTKYWPAGGGGLAVVHDPEIAKRVGARVQTLSRQSRAWELRNLFMQGAKAVVFNRYLYGLFGRPMRRWVEQMALLEPCLDMHAIQASWAAGACRQALRFPQRVAWQRINSLRLLEQLGDVDDTVMPRERHGAQYNYHMFPVLLRDAAERKAVMDGMWRQFVDTSKIYSGVVREARRFGYRAGCPVSESVADRLITLPNYASLTARDIDTVAEVFLAALNTHRRALPTAPVTLQPELSALQS
jgi:dTDP-4-amino-4,6-dideoxygalactose transaminase